MNSFGVRYVFAWIIANHLHECSEDSVLLLVRQISQDLEVEISEEEIQFLAEKVLEYKNNRPKNDDDFEDRFTFAA